MYIKILENIDCRCMRIIYTLREVSLYFDMLSYTTKTYLSHLFSF